MDPLVPFLISFMIVFFVLAISTEVILYITVRDVIPMGR